MSDYENREADLNVICLVNQHTRNRIPKNLFDNINYRINNKEFPSGIIASKLRYVKR